MKKSNDIRSDKLLREKKSMTQTFAQFRSLTIVICATDEADMLAQTVRQILVECRKEDIGKILIVRSQNAAENCVRTCLELERAFPDVVEGMIQKRPHVGGAIQDGFDAADTTHILLLPADLAIGLDGIPEMIEIEKRFPNGIVKTSRWLQRDSFHGYPRSRWLLNRCAQTFLRVSFHTDLTDLTNPVQIMPTKLCRTIRWKELNFPFLLELVLVPLRLGVPFREVATVCNGRSEGKSKNSFWQTALYLRTAVRLRLSAEKKLQKASYGL